MYKIAIATSNNLNVDQSFGSAQAFSIFEVEGLTHSFSERRKYEAETETPQCSEQKSGCGDGSGTGCGHGGCNSNDGSQKADIVLDCRCVVATKLGRPVLKVLERNAISAFDISCPVQEALEKISSYFYKIDNQLFKIR